MVSLGERAAIHNKFILPVSIFDMLISTEEMRILAKNPVNCHCYLYSATVSFWVGDLTL